MSLMKKNKFSYTSKTRRTCSLCGRMGHNARTCISHKALLKRKEEKQKKKKQSYFVPIQAHVEAIPSPHIVSLAQDKQVAWHRDTALAYTDKTKQKKITYKTVDFAQMVRHANKQQQDFIDTKQDKKVLLADIAKKQKDTESLPAYIERSCPLPARRTYIQKLSIRERIMSRIQVLSSLFQIRRFAIAVVVFTLLITLPFPAMTYVQKIQLDSSRVVEKSTEAFLSLQSATMATFGYNIPQAQYDLNEALSSFGQAEQIIDKEYKALVYVARLLPVVGTKIKSRQSLLSAGHTIALANTYMIKGLDEAMRRDGNTSLAEKLSIIRAHMRSALPHYEEALVYLDNIDNTAIPVEFQASFDEFKQLFATFLTDMRGMDDVVEGLDHIMGADGFRRYLIVFQNEHELRPSGGFIGSYATVDIQQGKILNIDVPGGGSYDLQGQLDVNIKPPLPLQMVNKRWEFQDANWFPDFRASAQKLAWFYRHSRDTTVDGVIAINASVLPRLLRVLGPLENETYDVLLSAEDVLPQLQKQVEEYDNDIENKPKQILSVLLSQILDSASHIETKQSIALMAELHEALSQKEIQFYFEDEYSQKLFHDYGWTGELSDVSDAQDYLMVVQTNLGGKKSDAQINQYIYHEAVVGEDGSVVDTVVIRREHDATSGEEFFDHPNVSYVRVYVPEGTELLSAGGFTFPDEASFSVPPTWYEDDSDISQIETHESIDINTGTRITSEFNKTVFGNWMVTMPDSVSEVYFSYRLPFNVFDKTEKKHDETMLARVLPPYETSQDTSRYSIVLQTQSGAYNNLTQRIIYPDRWQPVWKDGSSDMHISVNGAEVEQDFKHDEFFGIVMRHIQ